MPTTDSQRHVWLALASIVLVASGCSTSSPGSKSDGAFWRALRIDGAEEAYTAGTLGEMAAKSDLIVIGVMNSFELGRIVTGDAAQDVIGYGAATMRVDEVIAGKPPDPLVVEFLLPTTAATLTAEGLRSGANSTGQEMPQGRVLMFLHEKEGPGEAGLFRLVEWRGLWIDGADGPIAPLAPDGDGGGTFIDRSTIHSLQDLVTALKG